MLKSVCVQYNGSLKNGTRRKGLWWMGTNSESAGCYVTSCCDVMDEALWFSVVGYCPASM